MTLDKIDNIFFLHIAFIVNKSIIKIIKYIMQNVFVLAITYSLKKV